VSAASTAQTDGHLAAEPAAPAVPAQATGPGTDLAAGFFEPDGDLLVPASFSTSPWGGILHGRLVGGLTARAVERTYAEDPELVCSRLTIDMFRSAPLAPVSISTRTVRAGRRIAVLEVLVEQEDGPIGQGIAVLLRRGEQPEGEHRVTPRWGAPTPLELGPPRAASPSGWSAPWESWAVPAAGEAAEGGSAGDSAARTAAGSLHGGVWIRELHPLVTGEPLTPLTRLSIAADLASPVSNSSSRGLQFINADYTIYVGRQPVDEYIGIEPYGHVSVDGVAVGQCVVHDVTGPCGFIATTAVANSMARSHADNPRG
jgi:CBS domain-containing protein